MLLRRICELRRSELVICGMVLFLTLVLAVSAGCGKKEEDEGAEKTPGVTREYFAKWLKHSSWAFELRYPPNEELRSRIEGIGSKCDTIARFCAMYMNVRPAGKIYMMIFPGKNEAEELLGHEVPFVSGDTIFYEVLSPLGIGIAKLMMKYADPEGSKFDFVNEGLPTLLDFSGEDYHQRALDYVQTGEIVPLAQLVDNEAYAKIPSGARKEQAASFLGFLSYNYGPRPIIGLLKEDISVGGILMFATKKNLDALEAEWKNDLPRLASLDSLDTQP